MSVNLNDLCEIYFGAAYNNLVTITNNVSMFVHVHILSSQCIETELCLF